MKVQEAEGTFGVHSCHEDYSASVVPTDDWCPGQPLPGLSDLPASHPEDLLCNNAGGHYLDAAVDFKCRGGGGGGECISFLRIEWELIWYDNVLNAPWCFVMGR